MIAKASQGRSVGPANVIMPEISYFVVIPEDDPWETSPFQGLSFGIAEAWNLIRSIVSLPADVVEPALPIAAQVARRSNGVAAWQWNPAALYALDGLTVPPHRPFWVMLTSDADTARSVDRWIARQSLKPLHISEVRAPGRVSVFDIDAARLHTHFCEIFELATRAQPDLEVSQVREALAAWQPRPSYPFGRAVPGHNVVLPAAMALEGIGYSVAEGPPALQRDPHDYTQIIAELANFVLDAREQTYSAPAYRTTPPQPDVYLTVPSLYAHIYEEGLGLPQGKDGLPARQLLQMMQRQTGYQLHGHGKAWLAILQDPIAMGLMEIRKREVNLQAVVAGLAAAGTLSATVRLPAAINRINGAVRQFANHARSDKVKSSRKLAKTFAEVQSRLASAVAPELLDVIRRSQTGVKLVTDSPLEWLPVDGLPLMLRKDVSRITTTPGNLQVGLLARSGLIHLAAAAFKEILILSAIDRADPIADILLDMLEEWRPVYGDQIVLRIVKVGNREEFVAALNSFGGAVMIFDGHGGHDRGDGVGSLRVGKEEISIWDMRSEIRVPPVVILSACDTQAADRSHATTANAFLGAGAVTVLGSLLPVNAPDAAMLIARLVWRIAEYVPAVTGEKGRAILWSEVMAGMLRLHLILDLIAPLLQRGVITSAQYREINMEAISATTNHDEAWWENALARVSAILGLDKGASAALGRETIASSDAIRYVQIGNPELIVIKSRELLRDEGFDV